MSAASTDYSFRRLESAMSSQANAEQLADVLKTAAAENPDNDYITDALTRANDLVEEMAADVEDCQDHVDPDEFEAWLARSGR